tara:strand:- start:24 stop:272 length:249 start_codon:yes stop_codon:yes gene_type:complete
MVKVLETFQKLLEANSLSSSGVSEQDALEIFKWLNANFGLTTRINAAACIGEEPASDPEPEAEEATPEPSGEEGENNRPFFG